MSLDTRSCRPKSHEWPVLDDDDKLVGPYRPLTTISPSSTRRFFFAVVLCLVGLPATKCCCCCCYRLPAHRKVKHRTLPIKAKPESVPEADFNRVRKEAIRPSSETCVAADKCCRHRWCRGDTGNDDDDDESLCCSR
jgi:hypothetical protein